MGYKPYEMTRLTVTILATNSYSSLTAAESFDLTLALSSIRPGAAWQQNTTLILLITTWLGRYKEYSKIKCTYYYSSGFCTVVTLA